MMDNSKVCNWFFIIVVSEMYLMNKFATVFSLCNDKQSFVSLRIGWYNGNPFRRIVDAGLVICKWEGGSSIDNRRSNINFFVFVRPSRKPDFELDTQ